MWVKSDAVKKVQWLVSRLIPCDECAGNDGIEVPIGSPFPSGDLHPPSHPLLRRFQVSQQCNKGRASHLALLALTLLHQQISDTYYLPSKSRLSPHSMKGVHAQTYRYLGAGVFVSEYWESDNFTATSRRGTMRVATHPAAQNWLNVILDGF